MHRFVLQYPLIGSVYFLFRTYRDLKQGKRLEDTGLINLADGSFWGVTIPAWEIIQPASVVEASSLSQKSEHDDLMMNKPEQSHQD
jgi:hypothetical protein